MFFSFFHVCVADLEQWLRIFNILSEIFTHLISLPNNINQPWGKLHNIGHYKFSEQTNWISYFLYVDNIPPISDHSSIILCLLQISNNNHFVLGVYLAIVNTVFLSLFFFVFYFSPPSGIPRRLIFYGPSYFHPIRTNT